MFNEHFLSSTCLEAFDRTASVLKMYNERFCAEFISFVFRFFKRVVWWLMTFEGHFVHFSNIRFQLLVHGSVCRNTPSIVCYNICWCHFHPLYFNKSKVTHFRIQHDKIALVQNDGGLNTTFFSSFFYLPFFITVMSSIQKF